MKGTKTKAFKPEPHASTVKSPFQISMPKVSSFHSGAKMNQQSIHLFIPLQALNTRKV